MEMPRDDQSRLSDDGLAAYHLLNCKYHAEVLQSRKLAEALQVCEQQMKTARQRHAEEKQKLLDTVAGCEQHLMSRDREIDRLYAELGIFAVVAGGLLKGVQINPDGSVSIDDAARWVETTATMLKLLVEYRENYE